MPPPKKRAMTSPVNNTKTRRLHGECPACGHYGTSCQCHRRKTAIRRSRSTTPAQDRLAYIELCLTYLRTALDYAQKAGAPHTVARVQLAVSSALGAERHAANRAQREWLASREQPQP